MPTATPETIESYLQVAARLRRGSDDIPRPLQEVAREIGASRPARKSSTFRLYRRALVTAIDTEAAPDEAARLKASLYGALTPQSPATKTSTSRRSVPPRGPAKKRKTASEQEWATLEAALATQDAKRPHADNHLLGAWLRFAPRLGLRPIEWTQSRVEGAEVVVRCAKNSNGRGPASGERRIGIAAWAPDDVRELVRALDEFGERRASGKSAAVIWRPLARRLTRLCKIADIVPICPYTTRHIALATAKAAGVEPQSIAAIAGHRTTRTAAHAYAPASAGWGPDERFAINADPAAAALVRRSPYETRAARLDALARDREAKILATQIARAPDITDPTLDPRRPTPPGGPLGIPPPVPPVGAWMRNPLPQPRATTPEPPSTAHPVVRDSASGARTIPAWMTQRPGPMPKPPPGTTPPRARSMPIAAPSPPPPSPQVKMPRPAPMPLPLPLNLKVSLRGAEASTPADAGSALSGSSARSNADPPSPSNAPAPTAGDIPSAPPPGNPAPSAVALDELVPKGTPSEPASAAPSDNDFDLEALLADLPDASPTHMLPILPEILAGQHAHSRPATRSTDVSQAPPYGAHIPTEAENDALYARLREGEKLRLARNAAAEQRYAERNRTSDSGFDPSTDDAPSQGPVPPGG